MPKITPPQKPVIFLVALTLLVGATFFFISRGDNKPAGQSAESLAAEKAETEANKQTIINNDSSAEKAPNSDKTTDQIPIQASIAAQITSLSQADGQVTISGTIAGITEAGSCTFNFTTPNDKPVSRTVNGVVSGSQINCGPVSIAEGNFSYLGDWTAKLTYYLENGKSATAEKAINIK